MTLKDYGSLINMTGISLIRSFVCNNTDHHSLETVCQIFLIDPTTLKAGARV